MFLFQVTEHLLKMRAFIMSLNQMGVDEVEFAYLRALVLFGLGKSLSQI